MPDLGPRLRAALGKAGADSAGCAAHCHCPGEGGGHRHCRSAQRQFARPRQADTIADRHGCQRRQRDSREQQRSHPRRGQDHSAGQHDGGKRCRDHAFGPPSAWQARSQRTDCEQADQQDVRFGIAVGLEPGQVLGMACSIEAQRAARAIGELDQAYHERDQRHRNQRSQPEHPSARRGERGDEHRDRRYDHRQQRRQGPWRAHRKRHPPLPGTDQIERRRFDLAPRKRAPQIGGQWHQLQRRQSEQGARKTDRMARPACGFGFEPDDRDERCQRNPLEQHFGQRRWRSAAAQREGQSEVCGQQHIAHRHPGASASAAYGAAGGSGGHRPRARRRQNEAAAIPSIKAGSRVPAAQRPAHRPDRPG